MSKNLSFSTNMTKNGAHFPTVKSKEKARSFHHKEKNLKEESYLIVIEHFSNIGMHF